MNNMNSIIYFYFTKILIYYYFEFNNIFINKI